MSNIRVYELGETRWHMDIWFDAPQLHRGDELKDWMAENYPECLCAYHWNNGVRPYWELRGGDPMVQSHIVMMWSGDN